MARLSKRQQRELEEARKVKQQKVLELSQSILTESKEDILDKIKNKSSEVNVEENVREWVEDIEEWELYTLETEEYCNEWTGKYRHRLVPIKMTREKLREILEENNDDMDILASLYNGQRVLNSNISYQDCLREDIEEVFYEIQLEIIEEYTKGILDEDIRQEVQEEIINELDNELYEIRNINIERRYGIECNINWNNILEKLK